MIMNLHYFMEESNKLEFTFPGYTKHDKIKERLQHQMDENLENLKNKFDGINKELRELLKKVS